MRNLIIVLLIIKTLFFSVQSVFAQEKKSLMDIAKQDGIAIEATLQTELNSKKTLPEKIECHVDFPYEHSKIEGKIVSFKDKGEMRNAQINIVFTNMILVTKTEIPVTGHISRVLDGSNKVKISSEGTIEIKKGIWRTMFSFLPWVKGTNVILPKGTKLKLLVKPGEEER